MRVLVTGGAGFIGSHLCATLLQEGHEVLCLDNLYCGSKSNLQACWQHQNFEFLRHDIVQPILLEVDQIYHLACPASPVHYQQNPVKTVKTNVLGTIHCLGIAKRVRARVLLASTSEVYGDPTQHPQSEDYWGNVNPIGRRSCYDEGKRLAETLMMDYHRQNGVDIRIARIFNTYGPHMSVDDGRVVSNFVTQALRGQDLTIYGDGSQTRSFCYVSDTVRGLVGLMQATDLHRPVNLGNPQEVTVRQLADTIIRQTGSKSGLCFEPLPEDDPARRRPDISLAKQLLSWRPRVALEDGLRETIAHFRGRVGASSA